MYQKLSQPGNFAVDYLNPSRMGDPDSLAIYISGKTEQGSTFCTEAKHKLLGVLTLLMRNSASDNLVAVYIDISGASQSSLTAYRQMLADQEKNIFSRVLMVDKNEIGFDGLEKEIFCDVF